MNYKEWGIEEARRFIECNSWVYAKTMPEAPHYYVNRKTLSDNMKHEFTEFVKFIRKNGVRAKFWKSEYIYLLEGEWYYWTMGAPVEETFILNRASAKTNSIEKNRMVVRVPERN